MQPVLLLAQQRSVGMDLAYTCLADALLHAHNNFRSTSRPPSLRSTAAAIKARLRETVRRKPKVGRALQEAGATWQLGHDFQAA